MNLRDLISQIFTAQGGGRRNDDFATAPSAMPQQQLPDGPMTDADPMFQNGPMTDADPMFQNGPMTDADFPLQPQQSAPMRPAPPNPGMPMTMGQNVNIDDDTRARAMAYINSLRGG